MLYVLKVSDQQNVGLYPPASFTLSLPIEGSHYSV